MARPKKMRADELVKIVDDYYGSCGDGNRLKCSFLEEYAITQGFDVKAYDFRRCPEVRVRIEELRALSLFGSDSDLASYKSLDVDGLLKRCRNRNTLKNALMELDATWRNIYDQMVKLSKIKGTLTDEMQSKTAECEKIAAESQWLSGQLAEFKRSHKHILTQNAYLKKMLKTYLYPEIANEILNRENVIAQTATQATLAAMSDLVDSAVPSPFSQPVSADTALISRETSLLQRMKEEIQGSNDDA